MVNEGPDKSVTACEENHTPSTTSVSEHTIAWRRKGFLDSAFVRPSAVRQLDDVGLRRVGSGIVRFMLSVLAVNLVPW
jgi:hypothetical protein